MKFTSHLIEFGLFMMRHNEPYPRRQFVRTALIWVPTYVLGKRLVDAAENVKAFGAVAKANIKNVGAVAEANIKAVGAVDNTAGGGSCAEVVSQTTHDAEQNIIGGLNHWVGLSDWQAPASGDICEITFMLSLHTGDISAKNYFATVWNRGGTTAQLGSVVTNGTSTAVAGSNAWSQTPVAFTFAPGSRPAVTSGTFYHLACGLAAGQTDGSNYAKVRYHTTSAAISGVTGFWEDDGAAPYPVRGTLGGEPYIKIQMV